MSGEEAKADGRVERGRATRDRLVAAAREQFGEHGYEATSIEAILAAAGVKRGALYHHFESKQALFDAVLEEMVAEGAAMAARAARRERDPLSALRASCELWLRAALDPATQRIALIDAPAVVGWARWRELDAAYTLGALRAALDAIAETGRLPDIDRDVLAHMILASVSEAALFVARADDPKRGLREGRKAVAAMLERLVG